MMGSVVEGLPLPADSSRGDACPEHVGFRVQDISIYIYIYLYLYINI